MIYDADGKPWVAPDDVIGNTIERRAAQMETDCREIEIRLAEAMYGHGPEDRVRELRRSVGIADGASRLTGLAACLDSEPYGCVGA